MADDRIADKARLLRAISSESKLKLLLYLMNGERSVNEIVKHVGCAQPTISSHLKELTSEGILSKFKVGRYVYYDLKEKAVYDVFTALKLKKDLSR